MAVEFELKANILHIRLYGTLADSDMGVVGAKIEEFEAGLDVVPSRVCDMSEVTRIEIGFDEVWALAHQRRQAGVRNQIRSALVVATPVQRGIARMFQTLNDHPLVSIRIFDDIDSAMAWLNEP